MPDQAGEVGGVGDAVALAVEQRLGLLREQGVGVGLAGGGGGGFELEHGGGTDDGVTHLGDAGRGLQARGRGFKP